MEANSAARLRCRPRPSASRNRQVPSREHTCERVAGRPLRRPIGDRAIAQRLREGALAVVIGGATAAAVAYAPVPRLILMLLAAGLLVTLVVFALPTLAAVLLGVSIPEIQDVTGGHLGGLHVAASDVVLVLIGARILMDGAVRQRLPAIRALRPVGLPVVQYAWLIGVLLVVHLSLGSTLKSAQRLELFALPLLVGAFIALRREHMIVLRGYVLATTLLAVAWPVLNPTGVLGSQFDKNPVGQMIVGAILLLLAVRALRRLLWCMPLLLIGLGLTASRGAILAPGCRHRGDLARLRRRQPAHAHRAARSRSWSLRARAISSSRPASHHGSRTTRPGSPRGAASRFTIARSTLTTPSSSSPPIRGPALASATTSPAARSISPRPPIRTTSSCSRRRRAATSFAASFILLVVGAAFVLWRLRRVELAAAAGGVLIATVAHGMVDVYWVRGTPVLGWLLVGMVCGLAAQRKADAPALDAPA